MGKVCFKTRTEEIEKMKRTKVNPGGTFLKKKKEEFVMMIKVDKDGSNFKASGTMTAGMVKLMIGEMELIKSRLLFDLERSQPFDGAEQ